MVLGLLGYGSKGCRGVWDSGQGILGGLQQTEREIPA
jgi:hypothetical protein